MSSFYRFAFWFVRVVISTVEPQAEAVIGLDQRVKPIRVLHLDDDASFLSARSEPSVFLLCK